MSKQEAVRPLRISEVPHRAEPSKSNYEEQLRDLQLGLLELQRRLHDTRRRVVLVFEGMDAAGKGGVIKRLTMYLDPRGFEVHPITAPTVEESQHHYLRRFWLRLPTRGKIAIFDRSWYGRMLVEPIEGLCTPDEYDRAAGEICEFERLLADDGYIFSKFWLNVSSEEQLKRFREREADPLKRWKLTAEDWRNREKFEEYQVKADLMFAATDANHAPWWLIHGDEKQSARLQVLTQVVALIGQLS
jgi:polyphosphate kinase 2 (PPK2 family)